MNWISSFYYRYAALGFSTIPIKTLPYLHQSRDKRDDGKKPLVRWQTYQKRYAEEREVLTWSTTWPMAGIGVVTGLLSNLYVIDDDRAGRPPLTGPRTDSQERIFLVLMQRYGSIRNIEHAYAAADEFCTELGKLPTAISLTSKGKHFYFRLPTLSDGSRESLGNSAKFLPGIDTRGEGGYVLVPPSLHPSGTTYVWERPPEDGILDLPAWAREAITRLPNVAYTNGEKKTWQLGKYGVSEGSRNDTAASYIGRLVAVDFPDETQWDSVFTHVVIPWNAQNSPPMDPMELLTTFRSITEKERVQRGSARGQFYKIYEQGDAMELVSAAEIGIKDLKPPGFAVRDFVLDGTTQLFGKPKAGKSYLSLQMALAVALGNPLFPPSMAMYANANHPQGFDTMQGDVLVLALEDSELRLKKRMSELGLGDERYWPTNITFALHWKPLFDGGLTEIERWVMAAPNPRLVVVDPMAAFVGGHEARGNVFRSDYRMFRPIWELGQRRKVPLVIVDHASKSKGKMGSGDPFDAGAGTLGSQAAVDSVMILEHADKGPFARLSFKGRDLERGFLDLEHGDGSPMWRIALPKPESSEENDPKKRKNGVLRKDLGSEASVSTVFG